MRTTYKPKGRVEEQEKIPYKKPEVLSEPPVEVVKKQLDKGKGRQELVNKYSKLYMDMVEATEIANSMENAMLSDEYESGESEPKKKKWWIILLILLIVSILVGCIYYLKGKNSENVRSIQKEIDRLYTDEKKVDLKSTVKEEIIVDIVKEVEGVKESGKADVSSEELEISTIYKYFLDNITLSEIDSKDFDYKDESFLVKLNEVTSNIETYSVPGLVSTLKDRVNKINEGYKTYSDLLAELTAVSDYINFDSDKYDEQIRNIKHEPNKQELYELYAVIVAKQLEEQGKQAIEDKAKEKADKAKDKALEDANKAKKEAEKAKDEAEEKVKDLIDKVTEEKTTTEEQVDGGDPEAEIPVTE